MHERFISAAGARLADGQLGHERGLAGGSRVRLAAEVAWRAAAKHVAHYGVRSHAAKRRGKASGQERSRTAQPFENF